MNVFVERLSEEIFFNYFEFLKTEQLEASCRAFLVRKDIKYISNKDKTIISVKQNGIMYVNSVFVEEVGLQVATWVIKHRETLETIAPLDSHKIFICIFMYVCISNEQFLDDVVKLL